MKFLREKLEKLGCEIPQKSFVCRPCEGMKISGGFVPPQMKDAQAQVSVSRKIADISLESSNLALEEESQCFYRLV